MPDLSALHNLAAMWQTTALKQIQSGTYDLHENSTMRRVLAAAVLILTVCALPACSINEISRIKTEGGIEDLPATMAVLNLDDSNEQSSAADASPLRPTTESTSGFPIAWSASLFVGALDLLQTASVKAATVYRPRLDEAISSAFIENLEPIEIIVPIEDPCERGKCTTFAAAMSPPMDHIITRVFSTDQASIFKSMIKVIHLFGIVLGLGAATVLDFFIIKFLIMNKIKDEHVNIFNFVSKLVVIGLGILWASGTMYLIHYMAFTPQNLQNQKIWAKILIVGLLTVNGFFIHYRVLPLINKQVGLSLFYGLPRRECSIMLVFGTVSAISWYVPLALGAMPYLNFVVPATEILSAYALVLAVGIAASQGVARAIWREEPSPKAMLDCENLTRRVTAAVRAQNVMAPLSN